METGTLFENLETYLATWVSSTHNLEALQQQVFVKPAKPAEITSQAQYDKYSAEMEAYGRAVNAHADQINNLNLAIRSAELQIYSALEYDREIPFVVAEPVSGVKYRIVAYYKHDAGIRGAVITRME